MNVKTYNIEAIIHLFQHLRRSFISGFNVLRNLQILRSIGTGLQNLSNGYIEIIKFGELLSLGQ